MNPLAVRMDCSCLWTLKSSRELQPDIPSTLSSWASPFGMPAGGGGSSTGQSPVVSAPGLSPYAQIGQKQQLPTLDSRTQLFVGNLPFRVRWQDLVRSASVLVPRPMHADEYPTLRTERSHAEMWNCTQGQHRHSFKQKIQGKLRPKQTGGRRSFAWRRSVPRLWHRLVRQKGRRDQGNRDVQRFQLCVAPRRFQVWD